MPGGVNSPVRAFGSVGTTPRFIKSAKGACLYDEDGNQYMDYIGSWGPMILGHANEAVIDSVTEACRRGLSFGAATAIEVEMAKLVCQLIPSIEMVRMVNSGTEAVMSAIRLARGYTGRNKIIKFTGCYHGHSDSLLVKAGSGVMTSGVPDSLGVPAGCTQDTLSADYNNLDTVTEHFKRCGEEIAAVIVEPVAANMGVVPPKPGFLEGLKDICREYGALLIFDEVITGFRLGIDGAQGYFGVTPDLTTFGKIIGGGMPVGAYGGKREIMELVSPVGGVYQAGTLSGNPVAMAAGLAQLRELLKGNAYERLEQLGARMEEGIREALKKHGRNYTFHRAGSMFCLFFTEEEVYDLESAQKASKKLFKSFFWNMLEQGVYFAPSPYETGFISTAHTEEDIDRTVEAVRISLSRLS